MQPPLFYILLPAEKGEFRSATTEAHQGIIEFFNRMGAPWTDFLEDPMYEYSSYSLLGLFVSTLQEN